MTDLPDYTRPPVVEVAVGIQYAPLERFSAAHVGLYWSTIRGAFGKVEEQAPIAHIVEPPPGELEPLPRIELMGTPDLPRNWFIGEEGTRLIQVQRDRFLFNWRKLSPDDEYPRFPVVKKEFSARWEEFNRFLAEHGFSPAPDQCELTYVNHVHPPGGWSSMAELSSFFTTFSWRTRSNFLPEPDQVRWTMKFLLPDQRGRLHVAVTPVRVPPDNVLTVRYALTARGRPSDMGDPSAVAEWYDLAREWIVMGFADLVDEKTDALWERIA